jgi:hypothetical protein
VREDPNKRGLLFLGTDTGLYYSDGDSDWKPMRAGFPTVSVFDLQFAAKTHDLIVATHGRGIFIMDDISPLESISAASTAFHLFPIADATRWHTSRGGGYSMGAFTAPNPPNGVVISFFVTRTPEQIERREPVSINIFDMQGKLVRSIDTRPHAGINRVAWPLNYQPATALNLITPVDSGEEGGGGGRGNATVTVQPGTYRVDVTDYATQQTQSQKVQVTADPRIKADSAGFAAQTKSGLDARSALAELATLLNRMEMIRTQLHAIGTGRKDPVALRAIDLENKVAAMEDPLYNPASSHDSKVYLHYLSRVQDRLGRVASQISAPYGEAPSQMLLDELAELSAEVKRRAAEFDRFLAADGVAFNKFAAEQGVQALALGKSSGQ